VALERNTLVERMNLSPNDPVTVDTMFDVL
jgi:hypothetical protein